MSLQVDPSHTQVFVVQEKKGPISNRLYQVTNVYLAKAPSNVTGWAGDGAVWFKVRSALCKLATFVTRPTGIPAVCGHRWRKHHHVPF